MKGTVRWFLAMADLALEINDRYCSVLSGLEAWFGGALKFWQPETIKINVKTSDIFKFSLHFMELYDAEEVTPYCMTMFANLINFCHTSGRNQIDLKGSPTSDGTLSDPYLRGIYNSSGSLISGTTDDDSGSGGTSKLSFTATTPGTQ